MKLLLRAGFALSLAVSCPSEFVLEFLVNIKTSEFKKDSVKGG